MVFPTFSYLLIPLKNTYWVINGRPVSYVGRLNNLDYLKYQQTSLTLEEVKTCANYISKLEELVKTN